MILSEEVYNWLVAGKILNQQDATKKAEDKFEVVKSVQAQFENGIIFAKIAKYMAKLIATSQHRPATPLNVDTLKELSSPAAKIYNWNILSQAFRKFNVTVESDVKSLIVAGDQETIVLLLNELHATCVTWTAPYEDNSATLNVSQSMGSLPRRAGTLASNQTKLANDCKFFFPFSLLIHFQSYAKAITYFKF